MKPRELVRHPYQWLRWLPAVVIAAAISTWYFAAPRYVSDLVFPSPRSVINAGLRLGPELLLDAMTTLARVVIGWFLGCLCGAVIGLLMSRSRIAYAVLHPLIEAVRPLPAVALIPFFILWFGIGPFGQVLLIFLGSFMTLAIHTYAAVFTVPIELIRASASLGAGAGRIYFRVIIPNLLPTFKPAFQIAAALSFATGIAAEFMGAQSGLGFLIMIARSTLNTDVILLGTLIVGLESYYLDWIIRRTFERLTQWAEPTKASLQTIQLTDMR